MPGCWVINPSGTWQVGSMPGHCLMDRFLLAPARGWEGGRLLQARLGSCGGTNVALLPAPALAKLGTASWQLCSARGLQWGKKWGGGGVLLPTSPPFAVGHAPICA